MTNAPFPTREVRPVTTATERRMQSNEKKPSEAMSTLKSDAPPTDEQASQQDKPQLVVENVHAPEIGTRIQVLWRIVHNDSNNNNNNNSTMNSTMNSTNNSSNNNPNIAGAMEANSATGTEGEPGATPSENVEERWWGAVVQERTNEKVGDLSSDAYKNLDIHILLYDSYGEFDEEVVRVAFLPNNSLLDLQMLDDPDGGKLDWRLESDAMNDENETNPIRSLECVAREAEELVQMSGIAADADLQALSRMPHEVQLHVATAYRTFADSVKDMLGELIASKPTGYVVTAQDVQNIMARVRAQRQQQSGASLTGTAAQ